MPLLRRTGLLLSLCLLAVGCSRNSDLIDGPDPGLATATPDLVCTAQAEQAVVLSGEGLAPLIVDAATDDAQVVLPEIGLLRTADLDGAGTADTEIVLDPASVTWQDQTTMGISLGPDLDLADGVYQVRATNGSGREAILDDALVVVPPPSLAAVNPDLLCLEQGAVELTLAGTGFLDIDGELPVVSIGDLDLTASRLEDCSDVPATSLTARRCQTLVLTLDQGALSPGAYDVAVTNPAPAGCTSIEAVQLAVVPGPEVTAVDPQLFCAEQQAVEITLTGTGFLDVGGALPSILVGEATYTASSVDGCSPVTGTLLSARTCTSLIFELPSGVHSPGWQDLTVLNPPPADCEHAVSGAFYLSPTPRIDLIAPAVPCDRDPEELVITGADFLELDGQGPAVEVAGVDAALLDLEGCTDVTGLTGLTARLCTGLRVQVPAGTVTPDAYTVIVTNPDPMACQASADSSIGFPPTITSVNPPELCATGGTITVTGDGFVDGAVVSITNADHQADLATTFIDAQTLEALVPDPTPPGLYDITVTNPDGCASTLQGVFDVTPTPVVYFVDPFTAYNGISLQVVIYTSGIIGQVVEVMLYPTGQPQDAVSLDFTYDNDQRVQAVIPAGLAAGDYSVQVTDDLGCSGTLDDALSVVEQLSVAIERVELPFGWTSGATGVNVYSPADPGPDMTGFVATPRFYLNPSAGGPGSLASELHKTAYVSATRATAVVPAGLPVGMYDLVAVNPDGATGLLVDAFEVTVDPPPVVTDLAPSSLVNQDIRTLIVLGENFRDPTFSATCRQPDGSDVDLTGSVVTFDATSIEVSIDFINQTIQDGSTCIVRATNSDATYADFSALGVTNPSLNLENFDPTGDLNVARRAPCAAFGEPLPGARFVYAIGGDDGTTQDSAATTFHGSIEFAAVDPYGDLSPWTSLPYSLPAPRSFLTCTTVGRFVYAVGGNGGAGAVATAWRAQVLDPDDAPQISDIDLELDPDAAMAFAPGRYSYRLAALMAADDPINPGGETLASDPFLVQVPDIPEQVAISLAWNPLPGAVAYRLYRTAGPGEPSGTETLLVELDAGIHSYTDDGSQAVDVQEPLPFGALGQFADLPDLNAHREGPAMVVATDPADASLQYLYVMGGRDETGTGLASIERLSIQHTGDGGQTVGANWIVGGADIGAARWQVGAFVADDLSASGVMPVGETWIYVAGGLSDDLFSLVPDVVAMQVEAGGALGESAGARYTLGSMQPYRAGYAAMLFNDQLFAFGGTNAMPVTEGASVEMCLNGNGICSGGAPEPPDLMNWNNLGLNMTVARYLTSSVTVSAFVFLVGGVDDAWTPLTATEKTLW